MHILTALVAGCSLAMGMAVCLPAVEDPDPVAYRKVLQANPHLDEIAGEAFTWHAASGLHRFVTAWEAYGDPRWIDEGVQHFDWLIDRMSTEPDGGRGWVGPRMGTTDGVLTGPHVVGDANIIEPMLDLAEVILANNTLAERHGVKARDYVDLALHVVGKWDRRGSWEVDGDFAVYTQQDQWVHKDAPDRMTTVPGLKRTENMNKSGKMGVVMLLLYRITGDEQWRDRAVRIFSQYKRIMRLLPHEQRMIFNFWEPFGVWDLDPATGQPLGWVNVHPFRQGYQASEVGMMVQAYHAGIVFTRKDIELLIATNLWMWNKSLDAPAFVAADGRSKAGTLWSSLVDFDPTIRELRHRSLMQGTGPSAQIDLAYFQRTIAPRPVGFERRFAAEEETCILPDIPLYDSTELNFAAAIPGTLAPGGKVYLATQVRGKGTLAIGLYDQAGALVATLQEQEVDGSTDFDGRAGFTTLIWDGLVDGKAVQPGSYTVRWTLNTSRRERGLVIK